MKHPITLKQAIDLLQLDDSDTVWLFSKFIKGAGAIASVRTIRKRFDMQKIKVHKIGVHFYYDEYSPLDWDIVIDPNGENVELNLATPIIDDWSYRR